MGALLAAALAAAAYLLIIGRSGGQAPPAAAAFRLPGTPSAIYDAILPEIRDRIARDTRIVRVDQGQGAITMRFSAHLEDGSVRLVQIDLAAATPHDASEITILSRRFSFLPGRNRDPVDATLERSLEQRIRALTATSLTEHNLTPEAP